MSDAETLEFCFAMRSEIAIAAMPDEVWGVLQRPREWKPSIVSLERLGGAAGEVGEVLRLGQRPGTETAYVRMETLRAVRPSWRVQTLDTEQGGEIRGFVVYSLRLDGTGTRLCCDFVANCRMPVRLEAGMTGSEFTRRVSDATLEKLDADHRRLKALVERSTMPSGEP